MTIKEIDQKIAELRQERNKLEAEDREKFFEVAKNNIGRCFKVNGVFVKVLDIPVVKETKTGTHFNEYQYPALWLAYDDGVPFYADTLFSGAWGVGHDLLNNNYEEISKEEFNAEFDRRIAEFVKKIKDK